MHPLELSSLPATEAAWSKNPNGPWRVGGFAADSGLTGRKIVVDAYGPRIPVGGGAFSGKDATKVDRSGAYMARKIACDYVRRGASEAYVTLAYAIGQPEPTCATVHVDCTHEQIPQTGPAAYDLAPGPSSSASVLRSPTTSKPPATATLGTAGRGISSHTNWLESAPKGW